MFVLSRLLIPTLLTFLLVFASQPLAQACEAPNDFQGCWQWAVYAQSKEELPLSLQDMELEDVPRYSLALDIEQRGKGVTGRYAATANFLTKVEDGNFATPVETKAIRVNLESAFGGKVTVKLRLQGGKLYWKLVKSEGEHYFPNKVVLEKHQVAPVGSAKSCSSLPERDQDAYLQESIRRTIKYNGFNAERTP